MFRIFSTKEFDFDFERLDESEKKRVRKIMIQLKNQGGGIGKPLGLTFFREKKFGSKRLYFLSYDKFTVILAVGISDKKAQQETINRVISEIKEYEKFILEKLREIN